MLFAQPLKLLRQHAGPLALHTCYTQMAECVYYATEVVQRPPGLRDWVSLFIRFVWLNFEYSWKYRILSLVNQPNNQVLSGKRMKNMYVFLFWTFHFRYEADSLT